MRKTLSAKPRMHADPNWNHLGNKINYDPAAADLELQREKQARALSVILTNARDVDEAKEFMFAMGYLPYSTYGRINNRVTKIENTGTNGYLESIGRL